MKAKSLVEHLDQMAATSSKLDFFREPRRKEEILDMLSKQIKSTVDSSFLSKRDLLMFYAGMQFENKALKEWGDPEELQKVDKKKLDKMSPMEMLELLAKKGKAEGAIIARASVCLLYLKLKLEENSMN